MRQQHSGRAKSAHFAIIAASDALTAIADHSAASKGVETPWYWAPMRSTFWDPEEERRNELTGRRRNSKKSRAWNRRRLKAQADGEPFDEPYPDAEPES